MTLLILLTLASGDAAAQETTWSECVGECALEANIGSTDWAGIAHCAGTCASENGRAMIHRLYEDDPRFAAPKAGPAKSKSSRPKSNDEPRHPFTHEVTDPDTGKKVRVPVGDFPLPDPDTKLA